MASPAPLTVQTIMDAAHVAYTQATDTPAITDDDGVLRLNLINKGIDRWQFYNGVRWRELFVFNAQGPTIATGVVVYPISQTDFRELSSRLRLLRTDGTYRYVDVVSPQYYARYMDGKGLVAYDDGSYVCCITGSPAAGYQINLGWIPKVADPEIGAVANYDYYKYADKMTDMSDVPEMQNPQYLVAYTVAELFADDDVNLFTKYSSDATAVLDDMTTENDVMPDYESNAVEDRGEWAAGTGLRMGV